VNPDVDDTQAPRCALTELPTDMCACCRPATDPAPRPTVSAPLVAEPAPGERTRIVMRIEPLGPARSAEPDRHGWKEAKGRGQCANCKQPYAKGALIKEDQETGWWTAECCAGEEW
jgi:hypothetical protein